MSRPAVAPGLTVPSVTQTLLTTMMLTRKMLRMTGATMATGGTTSRKPGSSPQRPRSLRKLSFPLRWFSRFWQSTSFSHRSPSSLLSSILLMLSAGRRGTSLCRGLSSCVFDFAWPHLRLTSRPRAWVPPGSVPTLGGEIRAPFRSASKLRKPQLSIHRHS